MLLPLPAGLNQGPYGRESVVLSTEPQQLITVETRESVVLATEAQQ